MKLPFTLNGYEPQLDGFDLTLNSDLFSFKVESSNCATGKQKSEFAVFHFILHGKPDTDTNHLRGEKES